MSKQPVSNDITQRSLYQYLSFTEFIEFFIRVAELNYKDNALYKGEPLHMLVEALMDHMLPSITGQTRQEVIIEREYVSESEEDLDEMKYFEASN